MEKKGKAGRTLRVRHAGDEAGLSYRGTWLIRKNAPLGPYSRTMPRTLWWPKLMMLFLMSEVPR